MDGDDLLVRGGAVNVLGEAQGEVVLVEQFVFGDGALPPGVAGVDGIGQDRLHGGDLPGDGRPMPITGRVCGRGAGNPGVVEGWVILARV